MEALKQVVYSRQHECEGALIDHSEMGSQYVGIRYSERLAEAGIGPWVGSKDDSFDNALDESSTDSTRPM